MILANTISTAIAKGYREIKTKFGLNNVETSKDAQPFGFESNPIKGLIAITAETMSNEEPVVLNYLNQKTDKKLKNGESVIYATDSDGNKKATITMRADGTAEILGTGDFMVRFTSLETAYNELQNKYNNLVTGFNQHIHPTPSGPSSIPTPVPSLIPASSSTGDITKAKIEEIKTIE